MIEPLLAPPRMGRPVRDRRQVVNGILWKLSTGAAWRGLPERYGPWKTVYERFRRWSADGTWDRLLAHFQQHRDAVGAVDCTVVCVDSTTVRAPPACGRSPKRGIWPGEAIGRSRGGLTTKIHLACDGQGRPLAFTLTAGNVDDCTQFEQVMARISVSRCGPGRPRTRPERVVADKGYSSTKIRSYLRRRGIKAAIPEPSCAVGRAVAGHLGEDFPVGCLRPAVRARATSPFSRADRSRIRAADSGSRAHVGTVRSGQSAGAGPISWPTCSVSSRLPR